MRRLVLQILRINFYMILIVQVNDSVQGNLWQNLNFLSFLPGIILQGVPRYQVFSRHSYTLGCPTILGIFSTLVYFRVSHDTQYFLDTHILQGVPRYQVFLRHSNTLGCPTILGFSSTLVYFRVSHDTRYFLDTLIYFRVAYGTIQLRNDLKVVFYLQKNLQH